MGKSVLSFLLVVVIIFAIGTIAWTGVDFAGISIPSIMNPDKGLTLGLDLSGGSVLSYEAQLPEGYKNENLASDIRSVKRLLEQRLVAQGFTEASVYPNNSNKKILTVEIPSVTNPNEASKLLSATAKLEFKDSEGKVVLSGADIESAKARFEPLQDGGISENFVELKFKKDSVKKFADATRNASTADKIKDKKNYISIVLDGQEKSKPTVEKEINDDSAIISGSFKAADAKYLADIINIGQLPFELKEVQVYSVGPTLGEQALQSSLWAGLIGLILVILFMIIFYRLPGFIADIALISYLVIMALALILFNIQLTLPGIAGIILSIGMAVDANVVIFERLKEELRSGKTIRTSVDSGFRRAFTAIVDSNVTTIIAAVVLLFFGPPQVIGFAKTLLIGVIVSMFTAIVITRFLLKNIVNMNVSNSKLYGIGKGV